MPVDLISYEDVLAVKAETDQFHAFLGNGFSRACRNDIFDYKALFDRADFAKLSPHVTDAFNALGTMDFEVVMKALRDTAKITKLYDASTSTLSTKLREDAAGLREVLVSAIAESHPERPGEIDEASYAACRRFLKPFAKIYTVNYDLLLYWAFMQNDVQPSLRHNDGFRTPAYDDDSEYVTWEPEHSDNQTIYYLHGALHIFDTGTEIQKYTWVKTGIPLVEQIRQALAADKYPLFVAEGSSNHKVTRIRHSDFLSNANKSMRSISGSLVIYGHSLAPNDAHIVKNIVRSEIDRVFIGIFGNPDSESNQKVISHSMTLPTMRKTARPLDVEFFDAASTRPWG